MEAWKKKDLKTLDKEWTARVNRIAKLVETIEGVSTEIRTPQGGNRYPTLTLRWDEDAFAFTVADCVKQLSEGEPRIEVLSASNPSMVSAVFGDEGNRTRKEPSRSPRNRLQIVPSTLQPGEDLVVGKRLRQILASARTRAKRG